mmetsp:Transcript_31207/g.99508  ORF Transcript_31207/g.99508 Transcript_31207/m.99508 type:complete len:225 (+) Transcript_31207:419-1093(+)
MSLAISVTYISQSIASTACPSWNGYCCTLHASRDSSARRRLRSEFSAIRAPKAGGTWMCSLSATCWMTSQICGTVGAPMRTLRQRDFTASSTLEMLLQHITRRQAPEYFSIVRRSECWASLVSLSTSFSTSTLNPFCPCTSSGRFLAMSLIISCTMKRSWLPTSLGFISTWKLLLTVVSSISIFLSGRSIFQGLFSTLSFSTPDPYISRSSDMTHVFLPAPEGP